MSQMISLVMAANAWPNVRVFVTTHAVTAMKAQAPTGRGSRTRPRMVEEKIERRDQPCTQYKVEFIVLRTKFTMDMVRYQPMHASG